MLHGWSDCLTLLLYDNFLLQTGFFYISTKYEHCHQILFTVESFCCNIFCNVLFFSCKHSPKDWSRSTLNCGVKTRPIVNMLAPWWPRGWTWRRDWRRKNSKFPRYCVNPVSSITHADQWLTDHQCSRPLCISLSAP